MMKAQVGSDFRTLGLRTVWAWIWLRAISGPLAHGSGRAARVAAPALLVFDVGVDDPGYRARMHQVTGRHAYAILEAVQELARLGCIKEASTEIRAYQVPPLFKLYLLNGEEAFFGLYPLVEHNIPFPDGSHPMYDLMGKDAVVFRHSKTTGDTADAQFVDQAQAWFDSMWDHISYEFPA